MHNRARGLAALLLGLALLAGGHAAPAAAQGCPPRAPIPIPVPPGCEDVAPPDAPAPRHICLRLTATPDGTAAPGDSVAYSLRVSNSADTRARELVITLPHPPAQQLIEVGLDQGAGWVSAVTAEGVQISVDALPPGASATATVRLQVSPSAAPGSALARLATARWSGAELRIPHRSNLLPLAVGPASGPRTPPALELLRTSRRIVASFDGFSSAELVSLWVSHDGEARTLGSVYADGTGRLRYAIAPEQLPAQGGLLVAHGQCSEITATAPLGR